MLNQILSNIDNQKQTVIDVQSKLVSIPALGPENGGAGERDKANYLKEYLASIGIPSLKELNAPDPRVPCGHRPNLAAVIPGKDTSRTFWIISHMDVVPPGNRELWKTDPYKLVVDGDALYGRGVTDNHQGLVSSLLVAKALYATKAIPPINYGMLFVADEETGNKFGIKYVLEHHKDIFGQQDLYLVPDNGEPTSDAIEVAEKSLFWLKVSVCGKQCHASKPNLGTNSLTAAAAFILKIRDLYKHFDATNAIFLPPYSTFEPTKKEANVQSINLLPGHDVFYVDCRVLPQYSLDEVFSEIRTLGEAIAKEYCVTLDYEVIQKEPSAPPTPETSEILKRLAPAVRDVYGCAPKFIGDGGQTFATSLRRKGFLTAVWGTYSACAHQSNEYSSISITLNDAKVMAKVLFG